MEKRQKQTKAVAIRYNEKESSAPKVIASGKGTVADKIIEVAREAGIHIQQDTNLVELLSKVEIGREIPVDLYQTVAEILAFVYRVNNKFRDKMKSQKK
jgi:flagellar biosynthesis protein